MSLDLLEPLARLISTAEAIEGLRDLFAAEEPLAVSRATRSPNWWTNLNDATSKCETSPSKCLSV
jgi:hypothetical protein